MSRRPPESRRPAKFVPPPEFTSPGTSCRRLRHPGTRHGLPLELRVAPDLLLCRPCFFPRRPSSLSQVASPKPPPLSSTRAVVARIRRRPAGSAPSAPRGPSWEPAPDPHRLHLAGLPGSPLPLESPLHPLLPRAASSSFPCIERSRVSRAVVLTAAYSSEAQHAPSRPAPPHPPTWAWPNASSSPPLFQIQPVTCFFSSSDFPFISGFTVLQYSP
uniref:Uncharacterized protein n=1 Tax=Triticum urartu TaxID=4572 RepID=A0A8R7Q3I2_TRIUA